jgi:ubiquinone/menaquinone biosynthesis C-methylase UbiE
MHGRRRVPSSRSRCADFPEVTVLTALLRSPLRRAIRFWTTTVAKRSEYGRVWNSVSQSLPDARIAVAGYSDDGEWDRSGKLTAADVLQEGRIGSGDVVLEIGCGAGRVGVHLARQCGRWIGADVSSNMLAHATRALRGVAQASFQQLDGAGLTGIGDDTIDVVYCSTVLMHLDEWDRYRYFCEAYRVMKPGGRLYVDSFSLLSPDGWALFERLSHLLPSERPPHISKASTPQELEAYAIHAGFVDIRIRSGQMFATLLARKALRGECQERDPIKEAFHGVQLQCVSRATERS